MYCSRSDGCSTWTPLSSRPSPSHTLGQDEGHDAPCTRTGTQTLAHSCVRLLPHRLLAVLTCKHQHAAVQLCREMCTATVAYRPAPDFICSHFLFPHKLGSMWVFQHPHNFVSIRVCAYMYNMCSYKTGVRTQHIHIRAIFPGEKKKEKNEEKNIVYIITKHLFLCMLLLVAFPLRLHFGGLCSSVFNRDLGSRLQTKWKQPFMKWE